MWAIVTSLIVELLSDALVAIFYNKCCTENVNKHLLKILISSVLIFVENFIEYILITLMPFHKLFLDSILPTFPHTLQSLSLFQTKAKQNKAKQNKAKQNKTKQNKFVKSSLYWRAIPGCEAYPRVKFNPIEKNWSVLCQELSADHISFARGKNLNSSQLQFSLVWACADCVNFVVASISSYVCLTCCVWKCYFLKVTHYFWLLHSFFFPFCENPWALRQDVRFIILHS